ncbi:hypothetical protein DSLASN_33700 [Desulfoluna limicola]|uniref:Monooxygenase n=1 Tax=Desulfoluna limicola TaxID=2810562 RepID=A0ABN6FA71_9BACT|nr:hypothetical protein [Desulfoluna limicola]BCS97738.1 hypothetical protein DSLASN_33700 [Desulfoluna limicola]
MVIIVITQFPLESAQKVAKRYLEAPEPPDYMHSKGPYFYATVSGGVKSTAFYELDNSRIAEGMEYIRRHFACYFGIPGYNFEIQLSLDIDEGLQMIGM